MGNAINSCLGIQEDEETSISRAPDAVLQESSSLTMAVYDMDHTNSWKRYHSVQAQLVHLFPNDRQYQEVRYMFERTSRKQGFLKIERVQNPFLIGQYLLKMEELTSRYGHVETNLMFHGTKNSCVLNILRNNFDWRRHGESTGERFGKGISFSPIAAYAANYCDKDSFLKVMLLCEVVVAKECVGSQTLVLPDVYDHENQLRCDTAVKVKDRSVFVKFNDNEFYPLYKITFSINPK